jgi:TPR repeat protein
VIQTGGAGVIATQRGGRPQAPARQQPRSARLIAFLRLCAFALNGGNERKMRPVNQCHAIEQKKPFRHAEMKSGFRQSGAKNFFGAFCWLDKSFQSSQLNGMKGLFPFRLGKTFLVKFICKRSVIFFAVWIRLSLAMANVSQSESSPGLLLDWEKFAGTQFTNRPTNFPLGTNVSFKAWRPLLKIGIENGDPWAEGFLGHIMLEEPEQPDEKQEGIRLLTDSAQRGCAKAMEELGWRYTEGKGVQTDYQKALRWLRPAADNGLPLAQAELGYCYAMGNGVTTNDNEALKWFRLSAAQTNAFSMMHLGRMYLYGVGVARDKNEAKRWLDQAAELGNARAMFFLGTIARENSSNSNSLLEAFQWDKKSAERGDRFGCWELAVCYFYGNGTPKNLTNYFFWAEQAAVKGVGDARFSLGEAYRTGNGVAPDQMAALRWYRSAATNGHSDACFKVAVSLGYPNMTSDSSNKEEAHRYMKLAAEAGHREAQLSCAFASFGSYGGATDIEEGKHWLLKSAEAEWPRSEYTLGLCLVNGQYGFSKDQAEGIKWLRKAAEHDWLEAQSVLGIKLMMGVDVPKDTAEGIKWFRRAAEHGYAKGQNDLGYALETSALETPDLVEVGKWYLLAVRQNIAPARVNLDRVRSKLTEVQKMDVERRADMFHPKPVPQLPGVKTEKPTAPQ